MSPPKGKALAAAGIESAVNKGIKNLFTKKELIAPYCRSTINHF